MNHEKTRIDGKEKTKCRLLGWWQRYKKNLLFSLNRASLNNPTIILCFSAHHRAADCHALQSGPHQHRQPDTERGSSEAGRSVRRFGVWLAGHLTVGYQRDNNVRRQAGAVYVLQRNNCYPFKSHFLIGLAVVEGNLEKRQVRERLRERVRRGDGKKTRKRKKSLQLSTQCAYDCVCVCVCVSVVGVVVSRVKSSLPSLHHCCPGSSSHGAALKPGAMSHTRMQRHNCTHTRLMHTSTHTESKQPHKYSRFRLLVLLFLTDLRNCRGFYTTTLQ